MHSSFWRVLSHHQSSITDATAAPALSPRHSSEGLISNWTAAVHESLTKPIENVSDVEYSLVQTPSVNNNTALPFLFMLTCVSLVHVYWNLHQNAIYLSILIGRRVTINILIIYCYIFLLSLNPRTRLITFLQNPNSNFGSFTYFWYKKVKKYQFEKKLFK